MNHLIISKEFRFEASHVLPKHEGKCARLHGHSWVMRVSVIGPVDPETGFVLDYAKLKLCVNPLVDQLDHSHLGCGEALVAANITGRIFDTKESWHTPVFGPTFYPSSENLVVEIARRLAPQITAVRKEVRLYEVSLDETCTSRAIWRPAGSGE